MSDLRKRTYEILGLEVGSLTNEGGRDWNEAFKEAEKELKFSYKENEEYDNIGYRNKNLTYGEKINYMKSNDKDIILHILRNEKSPTEEMINIAKKNNTYLVNKLLKEIGFL